MDSVQPSLSHAETLEGLSSLAEISAVVSKTDQFEGMWKNQSYFFCWKL